MSAKAVLGFMVAGLTDQVRKLPWTAFIGGWAVLALVMTWKNKFSGEPLGLWTTLAICAVPVLATLLRAAQLEAATPSVAPVLNGGRPQKRGRPGTREDRPDGPIPQHPPYDEGFFAYPVDDMLDTYEELLFELQRAGEFSDELWQAQIMPIIRRFAEFVHFLPASEASHHQHPTGLFKHSLEVALFALRLSREKLFDVGELPPALVKRRKPRWRAAILLTALFHDAGKPITDIKVRDRSGRFEWSPHVETLDAWLDRLQAHGIRTYHIYWVKNRGKTHEVCALDAFYEHCRPPEFVAWMDEVGQDIRLRMVKALNKADADEVLLMLASRGDQESCRTDECNNPPKKQSEYGLKVDTFVIDAVKTLINEGRWKVNTRGAKVWVAKSANAVNGDDAPAYVVLNQAAVSDLAGFAERRMYQGLPNSAEAIATLLVERGMCVEDDSAGRKLKLWRVAPEMLNPLRPPKNLDSLMGIPMTADGRIADKVLEAFRLVELPALKFPSASALLLPKEMPEPLPCFVGREIDREQERRAMREVYGKRSQQEAAAKAPAADDASEWVEPVQASLDMDLPAAPATPAAPAKGAGKGAGKRRKRTEHGASASPAALPAQPPAIPPIFAALDPALATLLLAPPAGLLARSATGNWMIHYPAALESHYGAADEAMQALVKAGLLLPSPDNITRFLHEEEGHQGLVLTPEASAAVDAGQAVASSRPLPPASSVNASSLEEIARKREAERHMRMVMRALRAHGVQPAPWPDARLPQGARPTDLWLSATRDVMKAALARCSEERGTKYPSVSDLRIAAGLLPGRAAVTATGVSINATAFGLEESPA